MRSWIGLFCVTIALMLPNILLQISAARSKEIRELEQRIDQTLTRRDSEDAESQYIKDAQYGAVRVYGVEQPLSEEIIQRSVARRGVVSSGYVSIWDWQGSTTVTASARGLDSKHHFANSYLVGFQPFNTKELWIPLYTLAIRKEYQYDHLQYAGLADIWQTSRQAYFQKRGDCEDHAILLADWLINLGVDARVAMGTHKGEGHAWVVAVVDDKEYLLEATSKRRQSSWSAMPLAELAEGYEVEFQFNRNFFWSRKDQTATRKYRGEHWIKKSQFVRS